MKKIINLIFLFTTTLLYSCVDWAGGTIIMFANDSSHNIQMIDFAWPDNDEFAAGIDIFPGEKARLKGIILTEITANHLMLTILQ